MISCLAVLIRSAGEPEKALACAILATVIAGMAGTVQGQTYAEWFRQKKTQQKYLLEQVVALQTYSSYLHKGYSIAKQGTGSVTHYLGEEWNAHLRYYTRKQKADPALRRHPQVVDILYWQQGVTRQLSKLNSLSGFSAQELRYLKSVSESVLQDCSHQAELLEKVCSDSQIDLDDQERLQLIGRIHDAMSGNLRFATGFVKECLLYASRKKKEMESFLKPH